ncbi:kinesin motor domain protein [Trichinella nativa]|uniref:Kinesin-like protein n=1 Tax=Trichinella nativa TaxID=6335 RepID=A0A1Y3EB02_9BILA|nr:kinesin motor domain protein [Trichinella nativa]
MSRIPKAVSTGIVKDHSNDTKLSEKSLIATPAKSVLASKTKAVNPPRKALPTAVRKVGSKPPCSSLGVSRKIAEEKEPSVKKKRPKWDYKGRIDDMEEMFRKKEMEYTTLQRDVEMLKDKNNLLQVKAATDGEEHLAELNRQKAFFESELEKSKLTIQTLESSVSQLASAQVCIKADKEALQAKVDLLSSEKLNLEQELQACRKQCEFLQAELSKANDTIRLDEMERRKLHNSLIELKKNLPTNAMATPKSGSMLFEFDRVFDPSATQAESALDGYNVCIFAYGQTGSGKTYTMEGPENDENCAGMITLAMRQVFQCASDLKTLGWTYKFQASFVEIYNESLRDLLLVNNNNNNDSASLNGGNLEIKLVASSIRPSATTKQEVTVPGLTVEDVVSVDQVERLLKLARKNRAVGATKCNERSSRSHSVFRLHIRSSNESSGVSCEGSLNLVDLAGSERLKESCVEGKRLEETKNINRSLSCLGQVFQSLAKKDNHIPYRNSRLTYLLQNSLGGNSKTLMFVNISPKEDHCHETINSLRFATMLVEFEHRQTDSFISVALEAILADCNHWFVGRRRTANNLA